MHLIKYLAVYYYLSFDVITNIQLLLVVLSSVFQLVVYNQ